MDLKFRLEDRNVKLLYVGRYASTTRMHSSRMRTGRSLTGGCTWSRGGVPGPEGCTWSRGGVWSQGGGGVCPGGVSGPGGGVCSGGRCLVGGGSGLGGSGPGRGCVVSQHALRQTPPLWTEWMTDRCENMTLATTSLRPVINQNRSVSIRWIIFYTQYERKWTLNRNIVM